MLVSAGDARKTDKFPEKDVRIGIDFLKRCKIYTRESNVHLNEEISGYVYAKDKNGNLLDTPEKFNDHAMDALRYAIYSHRNHKKRILCAWL